jgi:hypothetical protein
MLTDAQILDMINYYGDRLPNPDTYPKTFMFYVQMYKYLKGIK